MGKVDKGLHVADKICIFLYNLLVCWGRWEVYKHFWWNT